MWLPSDNNSQIGEPVQVSSQFSGFPENALDIATHYLSSFD
jgi:hypothetical protein